MKEHSNGSDSYDKKIFGVKWKDFDVEMLIAIRGETK